MSLGIVAEAAVVAQIKGTGKEIPVQHQSMVNMVVQPEYIDEETAYKYQLKFIDEWRPSSDTWLLRYGAIGLAGLTAAGAVMVTSHYRRVLKLRSHGLIMSHLPLMLMPAASVGATHHMFVTRDLLLFNTPCAVCLNLRAVAIQLGFSVALPVAMATVSNFHLAERRMTYALPTLTEDPRSLLAIWRRLSRPLARPLALLAAAHTLAAAIVTHLEASEYYSILDKADQQDRLWAEQRSTGPAAAAAVS